MKTKFLFKISQNEKGFKAISRWDESYIPNCKIYGKTEDQLLKIIDNEIDILINTFCTKYIDKNSQSDTCLNCPNLEVRLPIDSFYCKVDNDFCMFGRGINKKNKENFLKNCRITDKKEGIWKAIETEKYKGFHHIIGRYLYPYCEHKNKSEKKINFNYHYPWEFFKLYQEVSIDRDFKIKMIKNKIPSFISSCALCPNCTIEINNLLDLKIVFKKVGKGIFRR